MDTEWLWLALTLGVAILGVRIMVRGASAQPSWPAARPVPVSARVDRALATTLSAAVCYQFFAGRIPVQAIDAATAVVGSFVLVALIATMPRIRGLVSLAALGVFSIENFGALGVAGLLWLIGLLLVSVAVSTLFGR